MIVVIETLRTRFKCFAKILCLQSLHLQVGYSAVSLANDILPVFGKTR
jgi:hypothetical protein